MRFVLTSTCWCSKAFWARRASSSGAISLKRSACESAAWSKRSGFSLRHCLSSAAAASCAEPLFKIVAQRVEVDVFNGHLHRMVAIVPAAAASLPHPQPVGRPVANTGKTLALDKSLRQARREMVFALPVGAQPAQDSAQNVAGQMRHAHMGQNEKTAIVNY